MLAERGLIDVALNQASPALRPHDHDRLNLGHAHAGQQGLVGGEVLDPVGEDRDAASERFVERLDGGAGRRIVGGATSRDE